MSRKTLLSVLALLTVAGLLLGACVQPAPAPQAPAATAQPAPTQASAPAQATAAPASSTASGAMVRVALLLSGPITDGGWNQFAYQGLQQLKAEGFDTTYTENVNQSDIPRVARGYADDGYNLIIGHGFEYGSAFLDVAPSYPKQWFFATTFKPQDLIPANTEWIDCAYYDAGYAAGALAALMSKSHIVGFVGGGDNPTQHGMKNAFITGASQTVTGTKGLGVVTGDYNDAAKGKEAASTMVGNGADVIWHAADVTGLGAIQGAAAAGAKVLGCYSDQTQLAPQNMGSSLAMDLANMVVKVGHDARDGKFAGGTEWKPSVDQMWHWTYNGGKSDHNPAVIPDDVWSQYLKIWKDLSAGKIKYQVNTAN
jgi:basic membrane protein A